MAANVLKHNYLTIPLPDEWEDASQVIALGPEDQGFRPNVVFSQEPTEPGETAADFAARQLEPLHRALTNYVLIEEQNIKLGPNAGFLREHKFSMDKGEIRQFQFYVIMGGRAYTFTFTHLEGRFESTRPTAKNLFAAARINPRGFNTGSTFDAADF